MFFFNYIPYKLNFKPFRVWARKLNVKWSLSPNKADSFSEFAMKSAEDRIYYIEPLYDGITEEQRFQKDVLEGKYAYVGEEIKFNEVREPIHIHILDGSPRKPKPLIRVEETLYKVYSGYNMEYYRDPKILKIWTPEEWEKRNG